MGRLTNWLWGTESKADTPDTITDSKSGVSDDNRPVFDINDLSKLTSNIVTPRYAMKNISTVFSCATDLGRTMSQLPVILYQKKSDSDYDIVRKGRNFRIFTQKPNDYQTLSDFADMCGISCALNGVFYAYVERNDRGSVMEIVPFVYQRNVVPQMDINGRVYYVYVKNDGTMGDPYLSEELFIVKGGTMDGFTPMSPIEYNAKLLKLAEVQDKGYQESIEKGITSNFALLTDNEFKNPEAVKRLKSDLKMMMGRSGISEVPIFENGVKPFALKLNPSETNYLNNSELTTNRICQMMNTPPHRIGEYPFSSMAKGVLSELDEYYMRNTVNPWLVKFENAMTALLPDDQKVKFNRRSFYSGSPSTMIETVGNELKSGVTTINEGRNDIGRDAVPGGDVFVTESNNASYGSWVELASSQGQKESDDNENR